MARSPSRPTTATDQPSSASTVASLRPMPRLPPVTSATPRVRSGTLDGAGALGGVRDRCVTRHLDLGLGQGPVGGPEAQRERQRLLARRRPALRCRRRTGAPTRAARRPRRAARPRPLPTCTAASTTSATSSLATGKLENGWATRDVRSLLASSASRSSSAAQVRGGDAEGRAHLGVQLTGIPDRRSRRRAAPRTGRGARARAGPPRPSSSSPSGAAHLAARLDRVGPAAGAAVPHQPASPCDSGEHDADVERLVGQGGLELLQLVERRRAVDAQRRVPSDDRRRPGRNDAARSRTARSRSAPG